jgi:eukaryotic-like serine/threonine-protein kinase
MPLCPGDRLGPYEVLSSIGAGGMGEVWKARDTRLNRTVAIKTSRVGFNERFEREARAVAALNHPHICSLYDVGPNYLVMEYVEGTALRGPLPPDQALMVADQILDALATAHITGIIHRDLKPGNIMVGPHGVKVLDFGLAKIKHAPASGDGSEAVTGTMPLTAKGSILGTLQYMSPEQIEGQEADARSDIFAFGIVLYELISGKRPFTGRSQASLIASILKEEPRPLRELQPLARPGLDRVLQTCLEKDPEKRWQTAREVKHALAWTSAERPSVQAATKPVRLWQGLAALITLIALGLAVWMFRPMAPSPVNRFEASLPEGVTPGDWLSISPDGRKVVFTAAGKDTMWIRDFDSSEWRRLPGTEGAASPFWSPDSRYLAFGVLNQLRKIDLAGGPPETLCTLPGNVYGSGAWNRDGVIILGSWGGGSGGPLWKISQAGGNPIPITQIDTSREELYHTWPFFLDDGKHFLYFRSGTPDGEGIYAGSLDVKPGDQSRERILASPFAASYTNGYLFFQRQSTLMAQPFDGRRLRLKDAARPVADTIQTTWFATGVFSVSPGGALAYRVASASGNSQLTWLDRQGKTISTIGQPSTDSRVALSPDGKRAALKDAAYGWTGDLWTLDLSSGRRTRLTFTKAVFSPGVWSPDGTRIAYAAGNLGDTLYDKASTGAGDEKELLKEPGLRHYPTSWSHDGRFLLYHTENAPKTGYDLWVIPLQGDRKPVRLLGDTFNEWAGNFSPDMRWIVYSSTETGLRSELFVRPFRVSEASGEPGLGEGKWQVTKDGGNWARWISDKEIVFENVPGGTTWLAVPVKTSAATFESGVPHRLFPGPYFTGWDVTPDGQRFLMAVPPLQRTQAPISVVLNWPALLKK